MSEEYCRHVLRVAVAQICQQLGWHAVHTSPLEMLTDILERYVTELGKSAHRYSEQCKYLLIKGFQFIYFLENTPQV
jgi:transcription initiation factor TFIID subunit 3